MDKEVRIGSHDWPHIMATFSCESDKELFLPTEATPSTVVVNLRVFRGPLASGILGPLNIRGVEADVAMMPELKDSVIMLRDIPKEQAKREVQELLVTSSYSLDYGEIADELRLEGKSTSISTMVKSYSGATFRFNYAGTFSPVDLQRRPIFWKAQDASNFQPFVYRGTSEIDVEQRDAIMELRDISKEQANCEVQELLVTSSYPLDYGEIADELRLDLKLVVQICAELIEEGVIEFA